MYQEGICFELFLCLIGGLHYKALTHPTQDFPKSQSFGLKLGRQI